MAIADIGRDDVLKAIDEFDELGRDRFLERYGFREATRYYVVVDEHRYDSKAILGVAHKYATPAGAALTSNEFSGGDETVSVLRRLGFDIASVDDAGRTSPAPPDLNPVVANVLAERSAVDTSEVRTLADCIRAAGQLQRITVPRAKEVRDRAPEGSRKMLLGELMKHDADYKALRDIVEVKMPTVLRRIAVDNEHVEPLIRWDADGSIGIGLPTPTPWVRLFSSDPADGALSAQSGSYAVFLFADDGTRVFLSLNQGIRNRPPREIEAAASAERDLLDQTLTFDLETRIQLLSEPPIMNSNLARDYERGNVFALPMELDAPLDPSEVDAAVVRIAELQRAVYLRTRQPRPDVSGTDVVHVLLRWNSDTEPRTIEKHKAIADEQGFVWWGKFGAPMAENRLRAFKAQVEAGLETHVYLYRQGDVWRTTMRDLTLDPTHVDVRRLPDYYTTDDCHLFFALSDFQQLDREWPFEHLSLVSNPSTPLRDAFRGYTAMFYVTEDDAAPTQSPAIDDETVDGTDDGVDEPEVPPRRPVVPRARLSFEWLLERTLWPAASLRDLLSTLEERRQVILAGPPGTGKTWVAEAIAEYLTGSDTDRYKTVQFHPSYTYEEFVVGLRPTPSKGALEFRPTEGILALLAKQAGATRVDHLLVIDEMNRANLPRVFGELLYLLEYRDTPLDLLYLKNFELPRQLMIIGTMNTADRSIRSIDSALRRRFEIFDCPPDHEALTKYYEHPDRSNSVTGLVDGFEMLNARLADKLDKHHSIGHTFFMHPDYTVDRLRRTWERQLVPLLEEYFFDQPDIVAEFSLSEFWPDAAN